MNLRYACKEICKSSSVYILTVVYSIAIPLLLIMFIHVQFGSKRGDYVVEFEKNCFINAFDILENVRYKCGDGGTCCSLRLIIDHGYFWSRVILW